MAKKEQKGLTLTYGEITSLMMLLSEMLLHGKECIARNKVMNELKVIAEAFEKEKMRLIANYADKDEKGQIKLTEDKKSYAISTENRGKFDAEFIKLLAETATFDTFLPSKSNDFKIVANLIINIDKKFNYGDGEIYRRLVEKLETVNKMKVVLIKK